MGEELPPGQIYVLAQEPYKESVTQLECYNLQGTFGFSDTVQPKPTNCRYCRQTENETAEGIDSDRRGLRSKRWCHAQAR